MSPVEPLISWLAAAALRSSLLILLTGGIQLTLRSWMPAKWRLLLWLPIFFVMAAPWLPECGWSVDRWFTSRPPDSELCCPSSPAECDLPIAVGDAALTTRGSVGGWWTIAGCWLAGALWFLGVVSWTYTRTMRRLR